jgi:maltooligosyltrehalose trehalohydrolase
VLDHAAYPWGDAAWHGVPLAGSAIYELHVGTFTPAGTLDAAVERLDHLVELGIDIVELLPVAGFAGRHGWGYDGVDLYAVHQPYGGPEALKRFVDAAHRRGLGVVLDVVYNHLGPAGNYLSRFGPYFTDTHVTTWGPAINLDAPGSDEVRRYLIDNATMWLRDYHLDGLRLDAAHALLDERALHFLEELAVAVAALSAQERRPLFLIAESDSNDPRLVRSREAGGYGLAGQWSDDFHHALHALLTSERSGYYVDFGSMATLSHTLTQVFRHDGSYSTFRGRGHGRPVDRAVTPGFRFLGYLQNHDQIGNRATGNRSSGLLSPGLLKVGAALVLTSPFTPMLFMGEEWGATTPWQFFTDYDDPDLADAVRIGRRSEFAAHGWGPEDVPDPQDPATMERSRLDWTEPDSEPHASVLDWHRRLLALRRTRPELTDGRLDLVEVSYDEDARWIVVRRGAVAVVCNLAADRQAVPVPGTPVSVLVASETGFVYGPGQVETAGESAVVVTLV